jgi:GH24 family phage-related lysozyme (muramidase)
MSEYKYNFTFEPTETKGSRVKGIASRPEEDEDNTPSFMDTFYESLSSFFSSPDEAKRVLSSKKSEEVDADLVYDEYEAGLSLKSEPVRTLEMVDDLGEQARRSSEEAALLRQEAGITQSLGPKEVINEAPEVTTDTDVDSVSTSKAEEESAPVTAETTGAGLMSPIVEENDTFLTDLTDFLKEEESFRAEPYRATKGEKHLTIGYGHYGSDVKEGQKLTQQQAEALLVKDINKRLPAVRKNIHSFDSLSSNLKVQIAQSWFRGGISGSPKTIGLINQGKLSEAADEFLDNDEYRNAEQRGRRGIIARMDGLADALRAEDN